MQPSAILIGMGFWSILLMAFGLAMDATAVAASCAFSAHRLRARDFVSVSILFGGFQAIMPVFGWLLMSQAGEAIKAWDHWVAFVLLTAIGIKMSWDALRHHQDTPECTALNPFRMKLIFPLAIATSIDALAAGIVLPLMGAKLIPSIATIGITTAVLSALGMLLGKVFGSMVGKRFGAFGGLVLVFLAVKTLAEHLLTDGMH